MTFAIDTNVLLRALIHDHETESPKAQSLLASNDVTVSTQAVCETIWVLRRLYKKSREDLVAAVRSLMAVERITLDRPAVEAGLLFLEAGGDFADAVIEYEGLTLGGDTFATFDKRAAAICRSQGRNSLLL